jgi:hypothetical protein
MSIDTFEQLPGRRSTLVSYASAPDSQSKDYADDSSDTYTAEDEGDEEVNQGEERSDRTKMHYISTPNSTYRWWIPKQGIHENIIKAEVQPYLGPEAVVAPGVDFDVRWSACIQWEVRLLMPRDREPKGTTSLPTERSLAYVTLCHLQRLDQSRLIDSICRL